MSDSNRNNRQQIIQSLPQLDLGFQKKNLPQYSLEQALKHGTLWKALYSPYEKGESRW